MQIRVNKFKCVGLGNCVDFAPNVFALDQDHRAKILDPNSMDDETLPEAAKSYSALNQIAAGHQSRRCFILSNLYK